MQSSSKRTWGIVIVVALIALGVWIVIATKDAEVVEQTPPVQVVEETQSDTKSSVIGTSVEGRPIEVHTYGTGDTRVLFVGGIHGGYEWNSVLLAYKYIEYLEANPTVVPSDVTIAVIPSLNPDGVFDVIGKEGKFTVADVPADEGAVGNGRFNANGVDLNRNFACKWKPESTWRSNVVSAGTAAFSEPEAAALRDYVAKFAPDVAVFWHSQSNAVYASECTEGVLPATTAAMNTYATAAGYPAVASFDAYEVTGDAEGWLASIGIPAITVELATHQALEWEKNLAGTKALLNAYSQVQ